MYGSYDYGGRVQAEEFPVSGPAIVPSPGIPLRKEGWTVEGIFIKEKRRLLLLRSRPTMPCRPTRGFASRRYSVRRSFQARDASSRRVPSRGRTGSSLLPGRAHRDPRLLRHLGSIERPRARRRLPLPGCPPLFPGQPSARTRPPITPLGVATHPCQAPIHRDVGRGGHDDRWASVPQPCRRSGPHRSWSRGSSTAPNWSATELFFFQRCPAKFA